MSNPANLISVVVPVYNGEKTISTLLDSLVDQTVKMLEVIVVNNNSTDETVSIIKNWQSDHPDFPLILVNETRQGRTYTRNKGICMASGDYIAFFDADCVIHRNWMSNCKKILQTHQYTVIGGIVKGYRFETPTEKVLHFLHSPKEQKDHVFKKVDEWDIMRGAIETNNVIIQAEALKTIGGFEDNAFLITGEDFDLFTRLLKNKGELIGFQKNLVVFHQHRSNVKSMIKQVFGHGQSFAECVTTHYNNHIVLLGQRFVFSTSFPFTIWLCLSKAFIVTFCLIFLTLFVSWYYILTSATFVLFTCLISWYYRFKKGQIQVTLVELFQATGIAILHKIILLSGRIWGSIKFRICCL